MPCIICLHSLRSLQSSFAHPFVCTGPKGDKGDQGEAGVTDKINSARGESKKHFKNRFITSMMYYSENNANICMLYFF